MQRPTNILLLFLSFTMSSLSSKEDEPEMGFKQRIEGFINKYSQDYTAIAESFHVGGNDIILDNKVKTSWDSTITLKSRTSFRNKYDQTVYQRLYLGFYQYETENQCLNALDSLLNCFGTDCGQVKWGENGTSLKTSPAIYLINQKEIIVCKIHCEHANDFWTSFKNDLVIIFGNRASGIIETGCGGPVSFREF